MLHFLILISLVFGISLIIYALFIIKEDKQQSNQYGVDSENIIMAIDKSVAEVDSAIEEFSKISEDVFKEMNQKYQELLYLYSLIEDKHKFILNSCEINVSTEDSIIDPKLNDPLSQIDLVGGDDQADGEDRKGQETVTEDEILALDFDEVLEEEERHPFDSETVSEVDSFSKDIKVEYAPRTNDNKYPAGGVKYDAIYQLQAEGMTASEIAKALNMGKGEVMLILELGKARG